MQPILAVTAPEAGMIYINGSFAGETGPDMPLLRPVNPFGAVYIEYKPLSALFLPMARRLVFSSGRPLAENITGMHLLIWPGFVCEAELAPELRAPYARTGFRSGGRDFTIETLHAKSALYAGYTHLADLPAHAQPPALYDLQNGAVFLGSCAGGQYLLALKSNLEHALGLLCAKIISIGSDEVIHAFVQLDDLAAHAFEERWQLGPEGFKLFSRENAEAIVAPVRPDSPQAAMRAAVEAVFARCTDSAAGYLSPTLSVKALEDVLADYDLCVEMKYPPPNAQPCIGLVRLISDALAEVDPLCFTCSAHAPFVIESLEPVIQSRRPAGLHPR